MIAQLENHPAWAALREWAREQREAYFENLGRTLYDKQGVLTDVDLAYKRGFFYGINRLLNQPFIELKKIERESEQGSD